MLNFTKLNTIKSFLSLFLSTLLFSHNLIYFFISWVGLNISLYSILLGAGTIFKKNVGPSEVTLKYFIVGAMITIFFLFSVVLFAINYLTFDFDTISYFHLKDYTNFSKININLSEKLFYAMLISIMLFKLGAFPFHFYLRDIYLILCPVNNMFTYTITLKVFIFFTLLSMLSNFWYLSEIFYPIIALSGMGSIISGAVGALTQQKLKAFFAYSYLNSIGFVLLAVSSGISFGFGTITFYSAVVYFVSYLLAWLIILLVLKVNTVKNYVRGNDVELYCYSVDNLLTSDLFVKNTINFNSLLYRNSFNGSTRNTALLVSLSSLLGLPPTLGFYAKALVYLGLVGSNFGQILLILALVFTPIMAYSYLRLIIKLIYPYIKNAFSAVNQKKEINHSSLTALLVENNNFSFSKETIVILILTVVLVFSPLIYFFHEIVV